MPDPIKGVLKCEYCMTTKDVESIPARTGYASPRKVTVWDLLREDDDPNPDIILCPNCAAGYHEYWDDMWASIPR